MKSWPCSFCTAFKLVTKTSLVHPAAWAPRGASAGQVDGRAAQTVGHRARSGASAAWMDRPDSHETEPKEATGMGQTPTPPRRSQDGPLVPGPLVPGPRLSQARPHAPPAPPRGSSSLPAAPPAVRASRSWGTGAASFPFWSLPRHQLHLIYREQVSGKWLKHLRDLLARNGTQLPLQIRELAGPSRQPCGELLLSPCRAGARDVARWTGQAACPSHLPGSGRMWTQTGADVYSRPPYPRALRPKTLRGCLEPRTALNPKYTFSPYACVPLP